MGLFDTIQNVKASQDASYVRPGHYAMLIEQGKQAKDRGGIPFIVFEMLTVGVFPDSDGYRPVGADGNQYGKCHFIGERASHLVKNGGPGADMFLPNIKAMIVGVAGIGEAEVTPELTTQVFPAAGTDSRFRGLVVEIEARNKKTKANKDFTRITYRGVINPDKFEELGIQLPAEWQNAQG